jgi:hypothetical protein
VTDAGDLSASTAAALVGSYGLQARIDDNNSIYVRDDTPALETQYRASFRFDPNSITMSSGNAHYIFYGYSGTSTVVLRIEFRFLWPTISSGPDWSTMARPGGRAVGSPSATRRT